MLKFSANKILVAASALLFCAGFAQAATPASPLTASPTFVSISYQLPSTPGAAVPVTLTIASGADLFVIDPTTVPSWLTYTETGNTAVPASPGPAVSVSFVASAAAGSLTAGVYSAPVHVRVSGYQDLVIPVSLAVADVASTVSVQYNGAAEADNSTITIPWVYGSTPYPSAALTVLSSDSPVSFSTGSSVTTPANTVDWIQLGATSAIAYNYGTPVSLNFLTDVLQNSKVGDSLQGQVTITYGSGPTVIHINIVINVTEPNATLSATNPIFPAYTPKHGSGSLTVVVTGSGFGTLAQGYTSATTVSVAYGAVTLTDLTTIISSVGAVHGAVSVVNPTTMILTIPWEDATPVSILNTVQPVTISITNGLGGETPVTATLNVTTDPIIYTVTDGAALEVPASGATPKFAPYEMVTIFGDNFGPVAGTPVIGTLDGVSRFPTTVTAGGVALTVEVNKQDGTLIADANILFVSNNQINLMVPSGAIPTAAITGLQFVVTSGIHSSQPFLAAPATVNPGIFTTSSTGQGQGAILLSNFTVNSDTNKAAPGSTVVIYATGLGIPNSSAPDTASTTAAKFPSSCISVASYVTAEGITAPATADGAVLVGTEIQTNKLPPCFASANQVTVSIGGLGATVTYAGWVSGSVTGLYQINATVPTKAAAGDLPVAVTIGGVTSQAGVTVAVN